LRVDLRVPYLDIQLLAQEGSSPLATAFLLWIS
jgi:hypothetical protein